MANVGGRGQARQRTIQINHPQIDCNIRSRESVCVSVPFVLAQSPPYRTH